MRTIKLPCHGIVVELQDRTDGGLAGTIESDLTCENDGEDCETEEDDDDLQDIDELIANGGRKAAFDGIESLILAAACARVDIESPAFIEAIETAVEAVENNYP